MHNCFLYIKDIMEKKDETKNESCGLLPSQSSKGTININEYEY